MQNTKFLFISTLFVLAFAERVFFDLGPNIELITMSMILASFYFGKKESFLLTFAVIALTDAIIGNSNIFIFTWSGFLIPAFLASKIIKKLTTTNKVGQALLIYKLLTTFFLCSIGLTSNLFFYFWTNFGVWLLSNMYPKTLGGLLTSYINALPFLRLQAIGTLTFVPLGFILVEIAVFLIKNYKVRVRVQGIG